MYNTVNNSDNIKFIVTNLSNSFIVLCQCFRHFEVLGKTEYLGLGIITGDCGGHSCTAQNQIKFNDESYTQKDDLAL